MQKRGCRCKRTSATIPASVKRSLTNSDALIALVREVESLLVQQGPDQVLVNLSANDLTLSVVQELVHLLGDSKDASKSMP